MASLRKHRSSFGCGRWKGSARGRAAVIEAMEGRCLLYAPYLTEPELPRVYLDTTYVPAVGGTTHNVSTAAQFTTALANAVLGDTIVMQAGATFTGNFTLPNKTSGSGWITIRTSTPDASFPAQGTRVIPANAGLMPKIVSNNANAAIATANSAHHYRLIGLEITIGAGVTSNTGIVVLGSGSQTAANTANNLIIDRSYIHGNATANVQNGLRLNSASTAVIDSYFDQCQATAASGGFESHNIGAYNGPGPYKLLNNTFSSATIPVIFGGALTSVSGLIPSDIEIRGNHFTRPESWRTGTPWYVKNLFELKNAQRVLFDGNVLEHNWPQLGSTNDGSPQAGFAMLLTVRDQSGAMPWATVSDVTVTNNIIRESNVGISVYGTEGAGAHRIKIENNLLDDIGLNWGNNDRSGMFMQIQTVGDIIVNHNTVINDGDIIFANGAEVADLGFTNNIVNHNAARSVNRNYGINGVGTGVGFATLDGKFVQYEVTKNAMSNAAGYTSGRYPAGNFYPTNFGSVGFVSQAARDYRLGAGSIYRNAGTDGKDLGADFNVLDVTTVGSISGTWVAPNVVSIVRAGASPTYAGTVSWTVTFSTSVSGVDAADFVLLAGGGVSGAGITGVSGSGNVYTITATAGSGDGSLGLNLVDNDSIVNLAGTKLGGIGGGNGNLAGEVYAVTRANPVFVGTVGTNNYYVRRNGTEVQVLASATGSGTPIFAAAYAGVQSLRFEAGGGSDNLYLNYTGGDPVPGGGIVFDAGTGGNALEIVGTPVGIGNVTIAGGVVSLNSEVNPSLTVNAGARVDIFGPTRVGVLTLAGGGVSVLPGGTNTLWVGGLGITGEGWLDLADNAMVVDYQEGGVTAAVDGVKQYLLAGRNGGTWDGVGGIRSSTAAGEGRAFGYAEAGLLGSPADWFGQAADASSVLLRYTRPGDANMDGGISADDRALFDRGRARGLTGWVAGDFNYDNLINGEDEGILNGAVGVPSPGLVQPAAAPVMNDSAMDVAVGASVTVTTKARAGVSYGWVVRQKGKVVAKGTGTKVRFKPVMAGKYEVKVTATDGKGRERVTLGKQVKLVVTGRVAAKGAGRPGAVVITL